MTRDPRVLCRLEAIADGQAKGFAVAPDGAAPVDIFVVRVGDAVFGYVNSCPHTGLNLDWVEDRFIDADGSYILCANHGALFRKTDGHCVAGPCAGDALKAVPVAVQGGDIVLI